MSRRNGRNNDRGVASSPEDRKKYMEAWERMMVNIWREKIEHLKVIKTKRLYSDINGNVTSQGEDIHSITHQFMEYGIFQDCGTGKGYSKGNGGDLGFTPTRVPREWFSRAYFASVMTLKEEMAYQYGEEFCGVLSDAISNSFNRRSTSMRSHLWGHHGRKE